MKFKFYEYEKCSTCKKARLWLESRGLEFERIPIRDNPPNKKELARLLKSHGGELKKLFNTSSKDYRDPSIKKVISGITEDKAFELLIGRGNLVKRPVLVGEALVLQGFKPEKWEQSFG